MIKMRNLDPSLKSQIVGDDIPGAAEKIYVCKAGAEPAAYWMTRADNFYGTIAKGYAAAVSGRNDVVYLSPDSHTQTAGITWAKNMTHLIGMYGPARMNQRSRIGCSGNFTPMLTVSGYGNTFANLYFMYGVGNAANVNSIYISGNRNSFLNCHFGCFNATELDQATFDLIKIGAAETYFKDCTFGQDSVAWTNGNMIEFMASTEPPRITFENCSFLMNADNAQVTFLKAIAGLGRCLITFKGCDFVNLGTALTYAIDGTGLGNGRMFFDINCSFAGATDIVASTAEAYVLAGHGGYVSADKLNNLIATNPDVS